MSADLPVISRFLSELYSDKLLVKDRIRIQERLSEYSLVAQKGDEVVGLLIAQMRTSHDLLNELGHDAFPNDSNYLEIQELFVRADKRGEGIGKALVTAVLARANANGLRRSMVYSGNEDYVRIARFYEQCGFKMWQIFMTR